MDACEGDTKHELASFSAWYQYGGIWHIKKRSNQGNLFSWRTLRMYNYFLPSCLKNCIFSLGAGFGDITYNSRRGILGTVPLCEETLYHLFNVDSHASKTKDIVKLIRKSKWHSQQSNHQSWSIRWIYYTL